LSGVQVSTNAVSTIPTVPITPRRTVIQPTTWYTCPAGKKAKIKGIIQCTGFGAAGTASFLINTIELAEWDFAGCELSNDDPFSLCVNRYFLIELQLEAGDFIQTTQNVGTNAEFNVFAEVQESPA